MTDTVDTSLTAIYTDLGAFVVSVLGLSAGQCVQGYPNRVAMPVVGPFVEMHITRSGRLATNVDGWDQTNPSPTAMAQTQSIQLAVQLSCYGPQSGDWAAVLSTLLRDDVACQALYGSGSTPICQPLYSDDPIRAPLVDEEQQYEDKWIVTAQLQYNPTVTTVQDFADALGPVGLREVDAFYRP